MAAVFHIQNVSIELNVAAAPGPVSLPGDKHKQGRGNRRRENGAPATMILSLT
ncbi:hypothetical protein ACRS85_18255 [Pluralibacter gergoviae]|uniref:hypothetical protein n=1 Tax=Pluralibacter gergoviae TaxID=61647 RepID=UPI003EE1610B